MFDYQHPSALPDEMVLPDDVYSDYLLRARNDYGVSVTSNSWGDINGLYDSFSRSIDKFTWDNPDFLNFFAAGNTGLLGKITIASPALGKNVMAIGSTLNSPLSFYERGLDSGFRITARPATFPRELSNDIGVTPANFGLKYTSMDVTNNIPLVKATPESGCSSLNNVGGVTGAAVIVRRGTCPFTTKAAVLQAAGAKIMILVNNDDDDETEIMYASNDNNSKSYEKIASVMIAKSQGELLLSLLPTSFRSNINANVNPNTVRITAPLPYILPGHHEFRLSGFSSRGPTKDGRLKPDVVAPGEYVVI